MAKQLKAPILPAYVGGRNSKSFYALSLFTKTLSSLFLVREMFKNKSLDLPIKIGKVIPYSSFKGLSPASFVSIDRFKQHLYGIKNDCQELFETEQAIAPAESRQQLIKDLGQCFQIGATTDNKSIYLFEPNDNTEVCFDSPLMCELGRLREIAFREVGEGTGNRRDLDKYDHYYKHLILWDSAEQEIVGSYRVADISKLTAEQELYSSSLFFYQKPLKEKFPVSMELGRSFVQPKYWGRHSLDYLWQGIGAYLKQNPHIRYLFGPVSLSDKFSQDAKNLMVYYFSHYYGMTMPQARSNYPYRLKPVQSAKMRKLFLDLNQKEAFKVLKQEMAKLNYSVPTLYKQYSELC